MKTNVSQASIDAWYGDVKDKIAPKQEKAIQMAMCFGVKYTRNEIGKLVGISQTSAGRAIVALIEAGIVKEVGRKECAVSGRNVGAVTLSLTEALGNNLPINTDSEAAAKAGFEIEQAEAVQ